MTTYLIAVETKPRQLRVIKGPTNDLQSLLNLIGDWQQVIFQVSADGSKRPMWYWDTSIDSWVEWVVIPFKIR